MITTPACESCAALRAEIAQLRAALGLPRAETAEANPEHPDWCMTNCGCTRPAGHDGRCDLTGPLPEPGCRCRACAAPVTDEETR